MATKTQKQIKLSLDEARLLVLGAQVLLGFQYRTFLEHDFDHLPVLSRELRLLSLALMLTTLLFLMWPISFHEIVENGEFSPAILRFATPVMSCALFPFGIALGIDVYTIAQKVSGYRAGILAGVGSIFAALFFWYGWEFIALALSGEKNKMTAETTKTPLHEKIDTVLTECRIVIPGTQAMLGFQLIAVLMENFDHLPISSQYIHLGSLLMMTLSIILLMAPAAYHRIVERGEDSTRLWRFSRTMLLTAMAILPAGLASECYVVARLVTRSITGSIWCSGCVLFVFYSLWFGFTVYQRLKK